MGQETGLAPQAAGTTQRQGFSEQSIEVAAETAGTVLAAQARAMVEARFIVAMRRPRDWDTVRSNLLRACERPGFAGHAVEKVWGAAWYRKPVGEGVEGFSVRFAEEAARAMGNLDVQTVTVYDDERKRIVTVTVTDLESNLSFPTSITLEKTVERKSLRQGEEAIRVRIGAGNRPVYVVPATDDDVFAKQQALASKALRNGVLRLLPGDIQAECRLRILAIRQGDAAKDPDKVRRQVVDAFAGLNVLPPALKEYLGHDIASCTPAELTDLRELYQEIKDGKTTWAAVMDEVRAERGDSPAPPAEKKSGLDAAADRAEARATTGEGAPPGCTHPKMPPSAVPPSGAPCPDCGELLPGRSATKEPTTEPPAGEADPNFLRSEAPRTGRTRLKE